MKDNDGLPSGSETAACSQASTGARCCGTNDWPSSGSCICHGSMPNCHRSADKKTCICSIVAPGPAEESVSSCTGTICCEQPSNNGPMCSCHMNLTDCGIGGGTPVPSCSVVNLKCEDREVSDCRGG